jgi:hypothetical protein
MCREDFDRIELRSIHQLRAVIARKSQRSGTPRNLPGVLARRLSRPMTPRGFHQAEIPSKTPRGHTHA